jgi:uroporphyrinogen III methyltransferase / synthase
VSLQQSLLRSSSERPLAGRRVLVTRAEDQAGELAERLRALGAEPVICATIKVEPPDDWTPLDRAIEQLERYEWVIFTSANGVRFFFDRAAALGHTAEALKDRRVGAVGRATAQALAERGVLVDFVPDAYLAEGIVAGIGDIAGRRILLPRADIARKALVEGLESKGATVDDVVAYRTLPAGPRDIPFPPDIDIAIFTSASTVRNFAAWLGHTPVDEALEGAVVACIGPITARAAVEERLRVDVVAAEHTLDGLLRAVITFLEDRRS